MKSRAFTPMVVAFVLALGIVPRPATAQIEDQLSAYTGENATGYLQPLADAFGASLNDGFYRSAHIPTTGFRVSLEVLVMGVFFGDDDRTFSAKTQGGFVPVKTVRAPTIVGQSEALFVTGSGGVSYAFPGGFNLNSFGLAVPQLRVASVLGTEAVVRWIAFNTGDAELGDVSLFGFGARHSISQYTGDLLPFDVAVGFLWQTFSVGENAGGDDLLSTEAFSVGAQASKRLGVGSLSIEPYTALSVDSFSMNVSYRSKAAGSTVDLDVDFDRDTTLHWTIGTALNLLIANVYGEYNIASQNSFSFGLALGNIGF